jgi:hypothetical protein
MIADMLLGNTDWARWTGKGMEFAGKLSRPGTFDEWAARAGESVVADVASTLSALGLSSKENRAKDKIWDSLADLFKTSESLKTSVENFVASYPTRFAAFVDEHWFKWPNSGAGSLRVVPAASLNRHEARKWTERFDGALELQSVLGGAALRGHYFDEMARQLGNAIAGAAPDAPEKDKSVDKPLPVGEKWLVGFDAQYTWKDQPGHYYVYLADGTQPDAKRSAVKAAKSSAAAALSECKDWLGRLTSAERAEFGAQAMEIT